MGSGRALALDFSSIPSAKATNLCVPTSTLISHGESILNGPYHSVGGDPLHKTGLQFAHRTVASQLTAIRDRPLEPSVGIRDEVHSSHPTPTASAVRAHRHPEPSHLQHLATSPVATRDATTGAQAHVARLLDQQIRFAELPGVR
jgi:hypothetical protein